MDQRTAETSAVDGEARVPRGLIGVVHLPAMPGDPAYRGGGFSGVLHFALRDGEALAEGGVDAIIVENFGSVPFARGDAGSRLPPHQVALITRVARALRRRFPLPLGVNCLRNDALAALGIAAAAELDFVRVNVHTGAMVTDQGLIQGEAHRSLRYRAALGAEGVAILADVLVKHAEPLAPLSPEAATRDCLERGLADAVIVTGEATGAAVSGGRLEAVRRAAGQRPLLLGSGMTPARAEALAPLAHGAIVGTWLKERGEVFRPVDRTRVAELAQALDGRFRQ